MRRPRWRPRARAAVGRAGSLLVGLGLACRPAPAEPPAPNPAASPSLRWGPCEPPVPGAECATMPAPLAYDDPAAGRLEVGLMRIRSDAPTGRQLWYLAGGPGGAGTTLLPLLHQRYGAAWLGADLYTLDHRGTGATARLSCPSQEAPGSPSDRLLGPQEIAPCFDQLQHTHGDLLPHLGVTPSARDVGAAIEATHTDQSVLLWGNSYGTYWAHRVLQLFPRRDRRRVPRGPGPSRRLVSRLRLLDE